MWCCIPPIFARLLVRDILCVARGTRGDRLDKYTSVFYNCTAAVPTICQVVLITEAMPPGSRNCSDVYKTFSIHKVRNRE